MKERLLSIVFILFLSAAAKISFAQQVLSIEKAISFVGGSKSAFQGYLNGDGFKFDNQTPSADKFDYSKTVAGNHRVLGFGVKDETVDVISWQEDNTYADKVLTRLTKDGFVINKQVTGKSGRTLEYTCRNYWRNVLVTFSVPPQSTYFVIVAGKLRRQKRAAVVKPVKSVQNNKPNPGVATATAPVIPASQSPKTTGTNYIVLAQKAYFNATDSIRGGVGARKKSYLVEGEKVVAQKEVEGFIYCDFTNAITHKTTSGWLSKMDIEKLSVKVGEVQVNHLPAGSPYASLLKLDNFSGQFRTVFNNPVVTAQLKQMLGGSYAEFAKDYLTQPLTGDVFVRHNVLFIRSFVIHAATVNAYFFFDLQNGQSFLYWNGLGQDYKTQLRVFGAHPVPPLVKNFIVRHLADDKDFMDDNERSVLKDILKR